MTDKEIIQAKRICFRDLDDGAACPNCPLYGNENCLAEVMGGAVDLLERLSGANAHLYEELEWKDKVIALAQRKQAEAEAERDALREKMPQWIPVTERLPKPEIDVLIVCNRNGCRFVTPAIYEDGKMLTQDSVWNWNEIYTYGLYSEESDDYYIPEGWWEIRQLNPDDVYNNPVDCAVTHWMPLAEAPETPEEGEKA